MRHGVSMSLGRGGWSWASTGIEDCWPTALKLPCPGWKLGRTTAGGRLSTKSQMTLPCLLSLHTPTHLQALQCDVSVEEDNRQEWTFTLYDFDNSGKVTREVMCPHVPHSRMGAQVRGVASEIWKPVWSSRQMEMSESSDGETE